MARSRNIKPGFFKNEVLAELAMEARMLFIGLWTLADREGRLEDRPKRVKMELFPYDSFEVDSMLDQLQEKDFLVRYESEGMKYIQIKNFVKHQDPHYKEKASEIPPPEGADNFIKATAVTRGQRAKILERDGYECQSCHSTEQLCIDHIIPASRGGCSSDDNLQVLCHSCNTKKGNRLDGEVRGVKKGKHNQSAVVTRFNVDSNLNQRSGSIPSDSLIPDSFNLIPDSGLVDSLIPEIKAFATSPPAKAAAEKKEKAQSKTGETWNAYSHAYIKRYRCEPVRNAKINGQLAQLVDRLGAKDAPPVAAYFISHNSSYYIQRGHAVDALVHDCEKLRTEWATGNAITQTKARQMDKTASNVFLQLLQESQNANK